MSAKKWIMTWFLSIFVLIIIGIVNFIVDPYQQYRKATFYKVPYEDERELNAGLAKNFEFESVVIGTSMAENFNLNDVKAILGFPKPIKLTMAGSSIYEQSIILRTALRHQKIKNVLWGLDFFSFYGDIHRLKHGEAFFPFYLYDENILNDYKYLVSSDTFRRSLKMVFAKQEDPSRYAYETMYQWYSKTKKEDTLKALYKKWQNRKDFDNEAKSWEKKFSYMKKNFETNLIPLIQEYKEVKFFFFFPPYSILAYKVYEQRGELKEFLRFKRYVIQSLSEFTNVQIYDFQYADNITHNLKNYYDLYHYTHAINRWILEQIEKGQYRVDFKKEAELSKKLLQEIKSFQVTKELFYDK